MKGFFEILGVICIALALIFLHKNDTANVAFFIGLAVYNHITAGKHD